MVESIAIGNVVCAMVCAKWALELDFSQIRQILCLIAGLFLGPIALLVLYVYLIDKAKREGRSGAKIV